MYVYCILRLFSCWAIYFLSFWCRDGYSLSQTSYIFFLVIYVFCRAEVYEDSDLIKCCQLVLLLDLILAQSFSKTDCSHFSLLGRITYLGWDG